MSELKPPQLDWKEEFVRDWFLPILPDDWANTEDIDDESIAAAKSILAQEYVEHGNVIGITKIVIITFISDLIFFFLDIRIYGLALAAYGSLFLATPALHTPKSLANKSFKQEKGLEELIRLNAKQSVKTNVGVAALVLGFVVQIFAALGALPTELAEMNWIQGIITDWLGVVITFIISDLFINGLPTKGIQKIATFSKKRWRGLRT